MSGKTWLVTVGHYRGGLPGAAYDGSVIGQALIRGSEETKADFEIRHKQRPWGWSPWATVRAASRQDALEEARARWPLGRGWQARPAEKRT